MERIETVAELRRYLRPRRGAGPVGLVPTMGYFHEGHLSHMRRAARECATTVVSLYVNPLQFAAGEDLAQYPRDLDRDAAMAAGVGVDVLFTPSDEEIYPAGPENHRTVVQVRELEDILEGASRPGHFRGVATVVSQLFNIAVPDRAYFGLKDYQQTVIIRRLVRDLHFDVHLALGPTLREEDGLALSSRNTYLNAEERQAATILHRALQLARQRLAAGERDPEALERVITEYIHQDEPLAQVEYATVRRQEDLRRLDRIHGRVVVLLAVRVGPARLIDNLLRDVPS